MKPIVLWDVATGRPGIAAEYHKDHVRSVALSRDGRMLAAGSDDQTLKLWNVDEGRVLRTIKERFGRIFGVAFSPDGSTLAAADYSGAITIWMAGVSPDRSFAFCSGTENGGSPGR